MPLPGWRVGYVPTLHPVWVPEGRVFSVGLEAARVSVGRALPALAEHQRADGTFGAMAQQERALIALRAFRWADPEA